MNWLHSSMLSDTARASIDGWGDASCGNVAAGPDREMVGLVGKGTGDDVIKEVPKANLQLKIAVLAVFMISQ